MYEASLCAVEMARSEHMTDMMTSAMIGSFEHMKVGMEKHYLGDRVVLTSMLCGAVTGHQPVQTFQKQMLDANVLDIFSSSNPFLAWARVRISVRWEGDIFIITFSEGVVDDIKATSNLVEPGETFSLLGVASRLTRGLWRSTSDDNLPLFLTGPAMRFTNMKVDSAEDICREEVTHYHGLIIKDKPEVVSCVIASLLRDRRLARSLCVSYNDKAALLHELGSKVNIIPFLTRVRVRISVEGESYLNFSTTGVVEDEAIARLTHVLGSIIIFPARVRIFVWGESYDDFITGVVEDENATSNMVEGEKYVDRVVLTSVTGHQPVPPDQKLTDRTSIGESCHQLMLDMSSIATIGCQFETEMVDPDRHKICLGTYEVLTCSCTDVTCPQHFLNMNTTTYITNPVPFPIFPNAQTESYAMYESVSEQGDLRVTDDNTFTVEHIPKAEVLDYNILVYGMSAIKRC
jgi:hypothetical protein